MNENGTPSPPRKGLSVAVAALLLTLLLVVTIPVVNAEQPVVRAVYFWAVTCPYCHVVMDEIFPPLEEEYGEQLEIATLELSEVPENYEVWVAAMEAFEVPPGRQGVPMLFLGDTVLVGAGEIPEQFPLLIEEYLATGGVGYPDFPGLDEVVEVGPDEAGLLARFGWVELLPVAVGLLVVFAGAILVLRRR